MKLNLRGGLAALAGSVGQTTQLLINDEVSKMREQRMAQVSQQAVQQQQGFQREMQTNQQEFQTDKMNQQLQAQGVMAENKIQAESEQAMLERSQELRDAETARQHDMQKLEKKAQLDLGAKTVINNNMGGGIGHLRGKKAQEGLGGNDATRIDEIQRAGAGVAKIKDSLNILEQVGSEFTTGKTQDLLATVGAYFNTDAAGAKQMVEGAVAPMVLDLMAQQKGPQTDADRRQFERTMASYDKSPEAFQVLLGLANKYAARATENAVALEDYMQTDFYKENGHLGEFKLPNAIYKEEPSELTNRSMGAADDPLGMF